MNSTAIALNTEAINHVQKGEFAEAITCLKCAIKMEDSFVLRLNLGLTYRDSGNFRKAKTALEKALELKGDDICALEELSLVCLKLEEFVRDNVLFFFLQFSFFLTNLSTLGDLLL